MVSELQKLYCLRNLVSLKLHAHKVCLSNENFPLRLRKYYNSQIKIERQILRDINNRLEFLKSQL